MKKVIINFTPTGMIPKKENTTYVPVTPNEIIEQVHEAYEIGITSVHLHARYKNGEPTYEKNIYRSIFDGVRHHCPDLVIGVSLSGRNFPEFEKRTEPLEVYPDMASITLSSLNFVNQASCNEPDMIIAMLQKLKKFGVIPELEVFDSGMINYSHYLIEKGFLTGPYYYNIILGNIASAQMELTQIGLMINSLPNGSLWSLGGIGKNQLPANMTAIANNGGVRVGLEDNIYFDKEQRQLASNSMLVRRIHHLAQLAGREIMPPKEFGKQGFYNHIYRNKSIGIPSSEL